GARAGPAVRVHGPAPQRGRDRHGHRHGRRGGRPGRHPAPGLADAGGARGMSRARIALQLREATELVRARMAACDWAGVTEADRLLRQALEEASRLPMSPPLRERIEQAQRVLRDSQAELEEQLHRLAEDMAILRRRRTGALAYARHDTPLDVKR